MRFTSQFASDGEGASAVDDVDDVDGVDALRAHAHEWTGPTVPRRNERTAEFLATTGRPPDEVIGRLEQLRREVTVEFAAINADQAGCRPEHFPVVLAAWDALMLERAVVDGGWQITSGRAPLIVVNGPVRHRLGFGSAADVNGSGFHANATVARAIELIVLTGFGVRPPVWERTRQGMPGRWAMCLAEAEEESPWEPLSTDGALSPGTDGVSATLVRSFEFVDDPHARDPEKLLGDIAATVARTESPAFGHPSAGIILCPEHARMLGKAGLAKHDVRRRLERETGSAPDLMIVVANVRNAGVSTVVRLVASWSHVTARVEQQRVAEVRGIHS
ncbi:MAG: hypothetical protein ACODAF_00655 [Actinomycetota bacterium]